MAKAREAPAPDPLVESEEEESEEEENSDSESDGPAKAKKAASSTPALATKKPDSQTPKPQNSGPPADSSSSEEDEGESGSEIDTDSPASKKPIASKPKAEPEKTGATKKARSKANAAGPSSPTRAAAGAKRLAAVPATPAGDADGKRSKRKSVENSEKKGATTDEGKKLFLRLWSEDDEIALLKGMIEYSLKRKADPVADLNDLHEFIKDRISIDVTRTQLQDKIRRMRKKYLNNARKEKNGKDRSFSNPHEQRTYDISKKIWRNTKTVGEETSEGAPKANGIAVRKSHSKGSAETIMKADEAAQEVEEEVKEEKGPASVKKKSVSFIPDVRSTKEWVFSDGTELLDEADRVDMEKQWKKFRTEEAEVFVKNMQLSHTHAKKVYDALKSSGD